ncbi:hypothetical protein [Sphingomonas sp. LT1P40]|uniref:hypothetical protein n=1 Tax=Alteristakelama amylovorans TaxID=3096166 RepID=UPI002FC7411E
MPVFCPSTVNWGSVAEVVGAVGSVSAVIVALGLALREQRRQGDQERARVMVEYRRRNEIITEALELAEEARDEAQAYACGFEGGPFDLAQHVAAYTREMEAKSQRALQLQALEIVNPSLHADLGYIAHMLRVEPLPLEQWRDLKGNAIFLAEVLGQLMVGLSGTRERLNSQDGSAKTR